MPGTPVRKLKGQRWPYVDTVEAARQRQVQHEITGAIVDGVMKRVTGKE